MARLAQRKGWSINSGQITGRSGGSRALAEPAFSEGSSRPWQSEPEQLKPEQLELEILGLQTFWPVSLLAGLTAGRSHCWLADRFADGSACCSLGKILALPKR